jgi:hypothetical protein
MIFSATLLPLESTAICIKIQFHLNRRFLARKLLAGAAGEGPLPVRKLAQGVKEFDPERAGNRCRSPVKYLTVSKMRTN